MLIVGSLILAIMLALLAAMRHLPATTVWLPALGTSAMCLVLGCVWLVAQGQPATELPQVAWDESVAEQQVAQAGKRLATASMPESAPSPAVAKPEEKESLEDLDVMVRGKAVDRKKADESAVAGRELPGADTAAVPPEAAAPADGSASLMLAEKAKKLQDSDAERFGMQLEQRQSLSREARSRPEAMKRRLAPENEAPRPDAVRQLERLASHRMRGVLPAANQTAPEVPSPARLRSNRRCPRRRWRN